MNFLKKANNYFQYPIPDEFINLYNDYLHNVWVSRLNITYIFCVILMPGAFVFDILIFPAQWQQLFIVRIVSTMVCILLYFISNNTFLKKYPTRLGHLLNIVLASTIAYLSYLTGAYASPYYAGLILIFIGIAMLVPWGINGALSAGLVILIIHLAFNLFPALLANQVIKWSSFWISVYFLTFTFVMVIISSGIAEKNRRLIFVSSEKEKIKNKKLKESKKKIAELSKTRRRFLTNITHELKTPLSIIIANIDIIQKESLQLRKEGKNQLNIIQQSAFQLSEHVDRILTVSQMDEPGIKLIVENFNYIGVVQHVFSLFKSRADKEKKIYSMDFISGPLVARIDVVKIEEVLFNLIQNAFKFTEPGNSIKVTVGSDGQQIYTEVLNTGEGIPKNQLKKIFERLYQADEVLSKSYGGIGIGLYICKRNVELHGGTISAHSTLEKGTSFRFTLPLHVDQSAIVKNISYSKDERRKAYRRGSGRDRRFSSRRESDQKKNFEFLQRLNLDELTKMIYVEDIIGLEDENPQCPSILIIEDNPGMLKVIVDAMREDYNLYIARNGFEALEKLKKNSDKISLILSDILMPEMSGFDLCQEVMSNEEWKHIPLIFITALFSEEDQIKGFELGATDFLIKPYNIRILKEKVSHWISRRQYEILLQDISVSLEARAKEVSKMKDFIIHEIRNPLQLISGADYFLQKLFDSKYKKSSEKKKELKKSLVMLTQGLKSLESVLNTSEDLIKDELPIKKSEPITSLFDDALEQCSYLLENINFQCDFSITSGRKIYCYKKMLTQVFVNLIRNAVDAIEKKGPKHKGIVSINSGINDKNYLILKIQDNGMGIPVKIQKNLFKFRFTTKKDGTGIGLHLSKMIMGIHKGKITIDSKEGVGTTISIYLPLQTS